MTELYDDLGSIPRIRLLELQPASDPKDQVHCRTATYDLSSVPPYCTISYTWGDAAVRTPIVCNGHVLRVTLNLDAALRSVRPEDEVLVLWVDAICINQENLPERSIQVQYMGEIFRKATATFVWLGEANEASEMTFAVCNFVARATDEETQQPAIVDDPKVLNVLLKFFEYPYWSRGWVIQELLLSQNAVLIFGNWIFPWDHLQQVLTQIPYEVAELRGAGSENILVANMYRLAHSEGYIALCALYVMKNGSPRDKDLLSLLIYFRNFATTDPRDKIYALLGLASPEIEVTPDYTVSVRDCYVNAAFEILKSRQDLRLFHAASIFSRNRDPDLPSWVPQWDCESRSELSPGQRMPALLQSTSQTGVEVNKKPITHASPNSSLTYLSLKQGNILCLEGMVVDSIVKAEKALPYPASFHERLALLGSPGADFDDASFAHSSMSDLGLLDETLAAWRRLGIDDAPAVYPTGEDPTHVFLTTVNEPGTDLEVAGEQLARARISDAMRNDVFKGLDLAPEDISLETRHYLSGLMRTTEIMSTGTGDNGLNLPRCYDTRLVRTEKGYLGLLPLAAEVGDTIALLSGGESPFVIRGADKGWVLVGSCYVHGMMEGEAWDESALGQIEFV